MFIKKLSLYLCVLSLFSFNQIDAGLREDLSKKKYAFSEPVLDEVKALNEVVIKGDRAEDVFKLMWEDAENGNEKVQEKLLLLFSTPGFYDRAKTRVSLLHNVGIYSLDVLIDIGIKQKKSWAFYQKALSEIDPMKKFVFLNNALNNLDVFKNKELGYKCLSERSKIKMKKCDRPVINLIEISHKQKDYFLKKCIEQKSGHDLYYLYSDNKSNQDIKKYENFLFRCLISSADLGYMPACIEISRIYGEQNNKKEYDYLKKLIDRGDEAAMCDLGAFLVDSSIVLEREEGLNLLLKAAEKGSDKIMFFAAAALKKFAQDEVDKLKVFNLCVEADKLNNADAMTILGQIYLHGYLDNVPNLDQAALFFLKAAEKGEPDAMHHYGLMLKLGFGNQEPNKVEGNRWILQSANLSWLPAMNYVSALFLGAIDEEQAPDYKLAYDWILKACGTGDASSLYDMGTILLGVFPEIDSDHEKAEKYLLEAVNKGSIDSMLTLSSYYEGQAKKQTNKKQKNKLYKKAAQWLKKAEEEGAFVNFFMPNVVLSEKSEFIDNKIRFKIPRYTFSFTAEQKNIFVHNLAEYYYQGYIGEKNTQGNIKKAYELFLCAAKNGYVNAMYRVGMMLLDGVAEQKPNFKKARKWFLCAAEKGHASSMVELAKLLIFEPSFAKTGKSMEDALFWLQKADAMAEKNARQYFKICEMLLRENDESEVSNDYFLSNFEKQTELSVVVGLGQIKCTSETSENLMDAFSDDNDVAQTEEVDLHVDFQEKNISIDDENLSFLVSNEEEHLDIVDVNDQCYNNPKFQREQLRKIGLLKKNQESEESDIHHLKLSDRNQSIVDMLLDKSIKNKNIDYAQLVNLFKDPFFKNQVQVNPTKSGCIVTAKNYKTLDYVVASTHKKHNKTYDGLNPFFARDLIEVLTLFGLTKN